jgi:hypothetical protein
MPVPPPLLKDDEDKTIIELAPKPPVPARPAEEEHTSIAPPLPSPSPPPQPVTDKDDDVTQIGSNVKPTVTPDPNKTQLELPKKTPIAIGKRKRVMILAATVLLAIVGITSYLVWMNSDTENIVVRTDPEPVPAPDDLTGKGADSAPTKISFPLEKLDSIVMQHLSGRWKCAGERDFVFEGSHRSVHMDEGYSVHLDSLGEQATEKGYIVQLDSLGDQAVIMQLEPFKEKLPNIFIRVSNPLQRKQMKLELIDYKGRKYSKGKGPVFTRK